MSNAIHLRYLAKNPQDLKWGLAVNSVGCQQIAPGEPYPPANHPPRYLFSEAKGRVLDEYQLLYIAEGRGYLITASMERRVPVQAGSLFLLHPGEWHSYAPLPETGWKEYWIGFQGQAIDVRVKNGFFCREKPVLHVGLHDDIIGQYEKAIHLATEQKTGFQPLLGSIVVYLLGLGYFYDRQGSFSAVEDMVNRAKILISSEFRTVGPEEVALRVYAGYSNFRRIFKEYTGFSPAKYILEIRMSKAKEALTNSTRPVKEIAFEMGYENEDYFFTAFRKHTGMTPKEYRTFTRGGEK